MAKGTAAASGAGKGAPAQKRKRTRRTRTAVYDDSSSSSSSSSSSESSSDEDEAKPVNGALSKGKGKAKDDDNSDSSSDSSSEDSSSSDSDSSSSSSSSSSSASSEEFTLARGKKRTALGAAAASTPSTNEISAAVSKRKPLPPQESEAASAAQATLSRREQKALERRKKLEAQGKVPSLRKPRFTPSPTTSEDEADDAQRQHRRMVKLHGRSFPASVEEAESKGMWMLETDMLPPISPPKAPILPGVRDFKKMMEERKAKAAGQSEQAKESGKEQLENESKERAKTEAFRDIWMKAIAEQFGEELNNLREVSESRRVQSTSRTDVPNLPTLQRDPALTKDPRHLSMLIDSLHSGAELFKMGSRKQPGNKQGQASAEVDEIALALDVAQKASATGKEADEMDADS